VLRQTLAALRKELLLQWRSRAQFVAVWVFCSTSLLLFSFAVGPNTGILRQHAAGFLWLALLLASTLSLSESLHVEMENAALEGQLLLPVDQRAIFYGKAVANWLLLTALAVALVPEMVVLYDASVPRGGALLGVALLGTGGLAAPGTLYAAMTTQARARQMLLPLLLFPLVVPVLLSAVKASALVMGGDPMGQLPGWLSLLFAFNVLHWSLGGLLFEKVVED
jgi:heme exporter protein B